MQGASQYPDNKCPMHPYALPSTLKIKFFWRRDLNRTSLSTQLSSSFFFFFFSSSRVCYPYGTAHILIFVSPCLQLCLVQIMSPCLLLYLIFIYYWFMVSSGSWPHCIEQVSCVLSVSTASNYCLSPFFFLFFFIVCFFFFLTKVWNLPYLLDRFGIIPDNKYPV